jgi:hypothetical protein
LSFIPDHNFDKTNQDHEIEHCDHESSWLCWSRQKCQLSWRRPWT